MLKNEIAAVMLKPKVGISSLDSPKINLSLLVRSEFEMTCPFISSCAVEVGLVEI